MRVASGSREAGAAPCLVASALTLTCISTGNLIPAPALRRASASASSTLSTLWTRSNRSTARAALLRCRWPTMCQRASCRPTRSIFVSASCTRFSPRSRRPASTASRTRSGTIPFTTPTSTTSAGFRPERRAADSIRSRTSRRRSLKEGGPGFTERARVVGRPAPGKRKRAQLPAAGAPWCEIVEPRGAGPRNSKSPKRIARAGGTPWPQRGEVAHLARQLDLRHGRPGVVTRCRAWKWWRRRESNPRPKALPQAALQACPAVWISRASAPAGGIAGAPAPKDLVLGPRAELWTSLRLSDARTGPHRRGPGDRHRLIKRREPTAHWQLKFPAFLTRSRGPGLRSLVLDPRRNRCAPWKVLNARGTPARESKRNVVVGAAAEVGRDGLLRRDRRPRFLRAVAPTPEHLHALRDDLGGEALLSLLVLPLPGLDPALDVHLPPLGEVLADDLGLLPPHHHSMPLGGLLLLAVLVSPALGGGNAQVGDRRTALGEAHPGIGPLVP